MKGRSTERNWDQAAKHQDLRSAFPGGIVKNGMQKALVAARALRRRQLTIQCDSLSYAFRDLPRKKLMNWMRVEASARLRPPIPWGIPTHLQIEPTNTCNLRCELCPVNGQMHRRSGFMDPGLYHRLLDEIGAYIFLILFWDWGEPFMHPSAFDMIEYAHAMNIRIVSSTNGHLFADSRKADDVIRCGLDTLIFAVDGISQETYETYRHRGDLERALQGIRTVVARKKELKSPTPLINFRFIVMKHNEHEVDLLPSFVRDLGVDALTLKTLNPNADNTYGERAAGAMQSSPLLPQDTRYRRFTYDGTGAPMRLKRNACRNPYNSATVHWNGAVCPCTYDFDDRFVMGNLAQNSFGDIWNGNAYREFRNLFRTENPKHYFCRECSYAYKGGSCIDETVHTAQF